VFCDSGFILLSPLNKALCRRAGISIAASAIALSLGLYATHTMVPPTPGPIAAAGIIKADIGLVILWGLFIAAIACLGGWLFAVTVARRFQISPDKPGASPPPLPSMENSPSAFASLMPILIPILLIVLRSVAEFPTKPLGEGIILKVLGFIGQPVVALLLGVALALLLPKKLERAMLSDQGLVGKAILDAAIIIIITGAGGAFGKVLQNSGIAAVVGDSLSNTPLGILLPFVIAAGIKTAQGSSTVSIITTAGLMAPLLTPLGLDGETARALVVVAIGAGAMVVSHANDSFFWVVTQFSNMSPETGYKLQTLGTLVEGVVAGSAVVHLDGAGDEHLAIGAPSLPAAGRIILAAQGDGRLVDLHQAGQRGAARGDHRPAQLGGEQPGRLVRAEPQLLLQLQRGDAVGMSGHWIGHPEPDGERQLGAA
jgi:GntP family gluconate:H+ symporter